MSAVVASMHARPLPPAKIPLALMYVAAAMASMVLPERAKVNILIDVVIE